MKEENPQAAELRFLEQEWIPHLLRMLRLARDRARRIKKEIDNNRKSLNAEG